jgi:hypothetical protein
MAAAGDDCDDEGKDEQRRPLDDQDIHTITFL